MAEPRRISLSEVSRHTSRRNLWIVIHNDVLDVTSFVDEHPGGAQLLLDYAGTDATFAFEDAGHSHDARELAAQYKIGWLPPEERRRFKDTCPDELVDRVICNKEPTSISCNYAKKKPEGEIKPEKPSKSSADRRYRSSPSKWKYALLLLAAALIAGIAYKKYSS